MKDMQLQCPLCHSREVTYGISLEESHHMLYCKDCEAEILKPMSACDEWQFKIEVAYRFVPTKKRYKFHEDNL